MDCTPHHFYCRLPHSDETGDYRHLPRYAQPIPGSRCRDYDSSAIYIQPRFDLSPFDLQDPHGATLVIS